VSDSVSGWLGVLVGIFIGGIIGGLLVYVMVTREAKTAVKSFAYDEAGRLIQVMEQEGL